MKRKIAVVIGFVVFGISVGIAMARCDQDNKEQRLKERYGDRYVLGHQYNELHALGAILDCFVWGCAVTVETAQSHAVDAGLDFVRLLADYRYDPRRDEIEAGHITFGCWYPRLPSVRLHYIKPYFGLRRTGSQAALIISRVAIWRPRTAEWWILTSSSNYQNNLPGFPKIWGETGDIPLAGDFDSDGKTDVAIWRPRTAEWWILTSSSDYQNNLPGFPKIWGETGDIPLE